MAAIHLDHCLEPNVGLSGGVDHTLQHVDAIDGRRDPDAPGERDQSLEFGRADNGVGDQDVLETLVREGLGFADFRDRYPASPGLDLHPSDVRAFVGLDMRPKRLTAGGCRRRHVGDVRTQASEIADQGGCIDVTEAVWHNRCILCHGSGVAFAASHASLMVTCLIDLPGPSFALVAPFGVYVYVMWIRPSDAWMIEG